MKDQAAVAHLPATLTSKWSLSSRDKKRLKQILLLCALIIALLWLLFQLAQMTIPSGAEGVRGIHVDGDMKSTVHVEPVAPHQSSIGGVGKSNTITGVPAPGERGLGGSGRGPGVAGNNDANPATGSNYDNQGGYSLAGGAGASPGGGVQQQDSPGFGSGNPPFFGFGNPALFFNGGGEGSQSGGAGSGTSGGEGSGANSGGNGNPGNGGNPANGQGNGQGTSSNGGGSSPFVGGGNPGSGGDGSSGNSQDGSTPGANGNDGGPGGNGGLGNGSGDGPGNGSDNGSGNGSDNGSGNGSGDGGGNGSGGFPNSDGPTQYGDGGGSSGNPGTDTITGGGPDILAPTVEVPEPNSIALFAGGFLALLVILRRQRRRIHPAQAVPKALRMALAALTWTALLALIADTASAETATVYGTTASMFSPHSGAFLPANTNLFCFSMNEANCWDGKIWHHLYPSGRRHYAVADTDRVACSVILAPSNDCWTGSAWYRLPRGELFGVIGGFFSNNPGAFITVPLRSEPVTYSPATSPSPLGEFASKR
jgi:hypothetical protein